MPHLNKKRKIITGTQAINISTVKKLKKASKKALTRNEKQIKVLTKTNRELQKTIRNANKVLKQMFR